jgi:hypothetical protein
MGPTCDVMHTLLIQLSFRQETKETEPRWMLLFYTIIFPDRPQNYKSNGIGFIIFEALNREL